MSWMLSEFGITDYKPRPLPCVSDWYSRLDDSSVKLGTTETTEYRSMAGSMYYLLNWTRPDVSIALNLFSRHMQSPNESALQCAKTLLRYLQGTADFGLHFNKSASLDLIGNTDAEWGSDVSDRKSISGYVFYLGSCPISWKSTKQKAVAGSSTEAEYMALSHGVKEGLWISTLMKQLAVDVRPFTIMEDNQSCIAILRHIQFSINEQRI
jgi:hypothetical protein